METRSSGCARIAVLGRTRILAPDGSVDFPQPASQKLLAALVAAGETGASMDAIEVAMWRDDVPPSGRASIRNGFARLRRKLPDAQLDIVSDNGVYRLVAPVESVDYWLLESMVPYPPGALVPSELIELVSPAPFAGPQIELVAQAQTRAELLQQDLLLSYLEAGDGLGAHELGELLAVLGRFGLNDQLASTMLKRADELGLMAQARPLAGRLGAKFEAEMGFPSALLAPYMAEGIVSPAVPDFSPSPTLPSRIYDLGAQRIFGRDAQRERLRAISLALVLGPSGAGKSTLMGVAATDLWHQGFSVHLVQGTSRDSDALAPFTAAFPGVTKAIAQRDSTNESAEASRATTARAWQAISNALSGPKQLVVLDDVHLFDDRSLDIAMLLARTVSVDRRLMLGGCNDPGDDDWGEFVADMRRVGAEVHALDGLNVEAVREMVDAHHPDALAAARRALAGEILDISGGLPRFVESLLEAVDGDLLELDLGVVGGSEIEIAKLSQSARRTGASAAVLGYRFSVSDLCTLNDCGYFKVADDLELLWQRGLVIEDEGGDPERLRFEHVFVQQAFLQSQPKFALARLHVRWAEHTTDIHERAQHLSQALTGSDGSEQRRHVAKALLASAHRFVDEEQWRSACRQFQRASNLLADSLPPHSLAVWAGALDRSGRVGSEQRGRAFRIAADAHQWPLALEAALSGLPEAELADGDLDRLSMLEQIDDTALSIDHRFRHAVALARQATLWGRPDLAQPAENRARELACSPDETALAELTSWTVGRHREPITRAPHAIDSGCSLTYRVRWAQMHAISSATGGPLSEAIERVHELQADAIDLGDPLRIWQANVLSASLRAEQGDIDGFVRQADEAFEYSQHHGLAQGTNTWAGQVMGAHWIGESLAELADFLPLVSPDLNSSALGKAATLLIRAESSHPEPGVFEAVALDAIQRPRPPSASVLELVASHIGDPHVRQVASEFLAPLAGTMIVVGFGLFILGPADMYLATLSDSAGERRRHLSRAAHTAETLGRPLWIARCADDLGGIEHKRAASG